MQTELEMAHDLIKMGSELKDQQLIDAGKNILDRLTASEMNNESQDPPETLKPISKSDLYVCQNCQHEMRSEKVRKRCPECRKHKLVVRPPQELEEVKEPTKTPFDEFTGIIKNNGKSADRTRYNPDTGDKEGVWTRSEAINVDSIHNTFEDDDDLCQQDKEFTQQVKSQVSPRRQKYSMVTVVCDTEKGGCGQSRQVLPTHALNLLCDKCVKKKVGRR